ncbi:MAG TPA: hypothetical protein VGX96_19530 [Candidatus Elarobacter sp.]|jgi:hypothetical protein|nr:hypothetical protein [Candidatus Elarobacter sp.]
MTFVLVYDRSDRRILALDDFPDRDPLAADVARDVLEERYRGRNDIEVVTLVSSDRDTLRRTHARYFCTGEELLSNLEKRIA